MSDPGSPTLSEALEAVSLNVDVEDPKLYHGDCVKVIAQNVADGSVDLVLNDPPYVVTDLGPKRTVPSPITLSQQATL